MVQSTPTTWFAEGRDPWRNLYVPSVVHSIGVEISIDDPKTLDQLGVALCRIAETYVTIEDEIQLEIKNAERVNWIKNEIIDPATSLIEALNRDYDFAFLLWPTLALSWLDRRALDLPVDPPVVIKKGNRLFSSPRSGVVIGELLTASR
jgi:hypothetical protein